jgi:hypothetical protein
LIGTDCHFEVFSNKYEIMLARQDLQLSDNILMRRIQVISSDVQTQLNSEMQMCDWFSLQFTELTFITDTAQLAVVMRKKKN